MIEYFITEHSKVESLPGVKPGCWVKMTAPSEEEIAAVATRLRVDDHDIRAAIDPEETTRIELPEGYTLIVIDIPVLERRHEQEFYGTGSLGILLTEDAIVTVCNEDTQVLKGFLQEKISDFSTKKKLRFVYQIMLENATLFQSRLREIDKRRRAIEEFIGDKTDQQDLIELHDLESSLVYFDTALRADGNVLERLTRYERIPQYPDDKDLLSDVIIENQQAVEMTEIYRGIIDGTRELMSTILDQHLNNVMKVLTSITVILAIPTVVSGLYGMNVLRKFMPLAETPHGFAIICVITAGLCLLAIPILKKMKML